MRYTVSDFETLARDKTKWRTVVKAVVAKDAVAAARSEYQHLDAIPVIDVQKSVDQL